MPQAAQEEPNHQNSGTSSGLAPLTDKEYKSYNRLAEKMELFHNHYKQTWQFLEHVCKTESLPGGIHLSDVIEKGLYFCMSLEMHHNIEETYLFPLLARRMPDFRDGNEGPLLEQHRVIHRGLSELNNYFVLCHSSRSQFDYKLAKSKMDSWGDVLREHLDVEVRSLGAENMRKYWTVDEVNRIRM